MPSDRLSAVLAAYFKKPYDEYGELAAVECPINFSLSIWAGRTTN